ncbi:MAG: DNA helicase UvrD, partial [Caldimonas sp.]
PMPRSGASISWAQRLASTASPWVPEPPVSAGPGTASATLTVKAPPAWRREPIAPSTPLDLDRTGAADARVAAIGSAVHRTLEWSTGVHAGWLDLAGLAAAAGREFAVPAAIVESTARAILGHVDGARFFVAPSVAWSGNEVPVVHDGTLLRLDRLVRLDDGTWWVLDYKLHHAPEALAAYRQQLLRYRDAVRGLQPGETVRCAFIAGDGRVVEIDSA